MGADLFLYISEEARFDLDRVRSILVNTGLAWDVREDVAGAALWCQFDYGGTSVIVELKDDLGAITIDHEDDAGLKAAFEIQRGYPEPLHIFDESYVFDFLVTEVSSLDELRERVYAAVSWRLGGRPDDSPS